MEIASSPGITSETLVSLSLVSKHMKKFLKGPGMHGIWLEAAANNPKPHNVKYSDATTILSPISWSAFCELVVKCVAIPHLKDYSKKQTFPHAYMMQLSMLVTNTIQ